MWDGAAIGAFDKTGKLLKKYKLPVIRPTNCKFDSKNSNLWITVIYDGLNESS